MSTEDIFEVGDLRLGKMEDQEGTNECVRVVLMNYRENK